VTGRVALVAVAVALAAAGRVAPAPTTGAYRSKAARTAGDALSELETARLAVSANRDGRMTQAYLEVLVRDAEDAYGSIQQTFDSVQPPDDPGADAVRDALDELLGRGSDGLGELRIAARRQDHAAMERAAADLATVATGLSTFDPAHPAAAR
jgi:hypothetical protein